MFATGVTMGLAKWIIDDTCLVISFSWTYFNILEAKQQKNRWNCPAVEALCNVAKKGLP